MKSKTAKRCWADGEDRRLAVLVTKFGSNKWSVIAEKIDNGRTGKQCRERWHNHLDPNVKKGDWSTQEDDVIINLQNRFGNQWAKIVKHLPGRTDNAVKNRFHSVMRLSHKRNGSDSLSSQDMSAVASVYIEEVDSGGCESDNEPEDKLSLDSSSIPSASPRSSRTISEGINFIRDSQEEKEDEEFSQSNTQLLRQMSPFNQIYHYYDEEEEEEGQAPIYHHQYAGYYPANHKQEELFYDGQMDVCDDS